MAAIEATHIHGMGEGLSRGSLETRARAGRHASHGEPHFGHGGTSIDTFAARSVVRGSRANDRYRFSAGYRSRSDHFCRAAAQGGKGWPQKIESARNATNQTWPSCAAAGAGFYES